MIDSINISNIDELNQVNPNTVNNLVAHAIPLQGKHLIEASAGTGKTFNITRIYFQSSADSVERHRDCRNRKSNARNQFQFAILKRGKHQPRSIQGQIPSRQFLGHLVRTLQNGNAFSGSFVPTVQIGKF